MRNSLKKILIVILSSFISLSTSCKAENKIKTTDSTNSIGHKQVNQNDHIYKTKEWKNISTFWQSLNDVDYNLKQDKLLKIYNKLETEYKSVNENLIQLKDKKYITENEYRTLSKEINRKYSDVIKRNPTISCYKAVATDAKQQILESDLENRYKTIEKLFDEGKINTKTFETTKNQIEKDLKELYKLENKEDNNSIDQKTADLIINLNR